jgi:hypothetical protein
VSAYDFELLFALPMPGDDPEQYVEALGDAGCTDALLGVGRRGQIAMMFTREAASAEAAVLSAIKDVMGAVPGARVVETAPDLVGLSDVAELLGVSRQNVRKLVVDSPASPPAPAHLGNPALWHLADLLRWLREVKRYKVDDRLVEVAEVTRQVNLAIAGKAANRRAQREILALLR